MTKALNLVIGAGAGGGLVSWAFTIITGAGFGLNIWAALPLCIILGAAAALAAVYVITPTDVTQTGRLIGYALLCGFLWKPVLDAGRLIVSQHVEANEASEQLKSNVDQLKSSSAAPAEVGEKANQAATHAAKLLRTTDRLNNQKLEEQASTQATEAVKVIADKAAVNPAAATQALTQIKTAAEDSNNAVVVKAAVQNLELIKRNSALMAAPAPPRFPR